MFVRNCWYVAAWDYELSAETLLGRSILGEPIVFFRRSDRNVVALEDRCCHRAAPLSLGRKEGDYLRCGYHGLKFDSNGKCVEIPGQDKIPPSARVRAFPVVERHSWIWIWMGDPALTDESLIPPAVALDHSDWRLRAGYLHYDASYLLICDNLLDFSHLTFVHAGTFGGTDAWADQLPKVQRVDRGLRIVHTMKGVDAGPMLAERVQTGQVDVFNVYDFLIPGILLLRGSRPPAGTVSVEPGEHDFSSFSCQAVTPETEGTSHYFFSWGPRKSADSPGLLDLMWRTALAAFEEDRKMIEAQQRRVNINPDLTRVATGADSALYSFRRLIERLIAAEQQVGKPMQAQPG